MRRILYVVLVVLLYSLSTFAQTAQLTSLITDPSGAVVPQATVSLTNRDTGEKYQTDSNVAGVYTLPFVKPGPYVVTVEKIGFKTVHRTNIKIDVSQHARLDFTLEVGQVTSTAPLVNTSDGTVSDVVTGKQIVDLNLNGRNYQALLTLVPGAIPDNSFTRPLTSARADLYRVTGIPTATDTRVIN